MIAHADDVALSDYADGRQVAGEIAAHAESCQACRERVHAFRELKSEATMERLRTYDAPDIWPAVASLTIHRVMVRRMVLREFRRSFALWLLVTFVLGIVAADAVREVSRQIALLSYRVAPIPEAGRVEEALKQLEKVKGRQ